MGIKIKWLIIIYVIMIRLEFYNLKYVSFRIIDPNKMKWKNHRTKEMREGGGIEMTENFSTILLKKLECK